MENYGKKFEEQFKRDWSKIKDSVIIRFPDQQSGYYGSTNPCDFLIFKYPNVYLIECKSVKGNTFPFSNFPQYDKLKSFNVKGLYAGVVIWFRDHDTILYCPISTFNLYKELGKKSINIKDYKEIDENIITIPTIKRRKFLTADYTPILKGFIDE